MNTPSNGCDCKTVEFAYPSSEHAAEFGHEVTGCWLVLVLLAAGEQRVMAVTMEREDALRWARLLPEPWAWSFRHIYPNDAR